MLTRDQLLQFEQNLLKIANEHELYTSEYPYESILDRDKDAHNKESELSNLLEAALETEKVKEHDSTLENVTDETSASIEEEVDPPLQDDTVQIDQVLQDAVEASDGIEAMSYKTEDEESEFVLPAKYKTITDNSTNGDVDDEVDSEKALIDTDVSGIQNFDITKYEKSLEDDELLDEIDAEQINKFVQEAEEDETLDSHEQSVNTIFDATDENIFFENLSKYSIFLKQAIIKIIKTGDEHSVAMVMNAVINFSSSSYIHRLCESSLNDSVLLLKDEYIYRFEELSNRLSSISENLQKVAHNFFINILPKVAVVVVVLFSSYLWIFQPLRAWYYYKKGYAYLEEQEYQKSEENFVKASSIRYMERYYFKYAEQYLHYQLYMKAEKKYEQLLFGLNNQLRQYLVKKIIQDDYLKRIFINGKEYSLYSIINFKRKGFLRLISFSKEELGNNDFALSLYDLWLFEHNDDLSFRLGKAGTYIDMYDQYQDQYYLTQAKEEYNKVASNTAYEIQSLIQRLRWAVRADNKEAKRYIKEVVIKNKVLTNAFFKNQYFTAYTEVIEYLLNEENYEVVPDILEVLLKENPDSAYLNFLQAKYFYRSKQYEQALDEFSVSLAQYDMQENRDINDIHRILEAKLLQVNIYQDLGNILHSETLLNEAQVLYEKYLFNAPNSIKKVFAKLYFLKSKIFFYRNEIEIAEQYIRKALEEQYDLPQAKYHYALIHYVQEHWLEASRLFLELLPVYPQANENRKILLYATANTLFKKKNYEAALVYYQEVLQIQNDVFRSNTNLSLIDIGIDEFTIEEIEKLAYIKNNVGVAFFELYKRYFNNEEYLVKATKELQEAHTILQNLDRANNLRKAFNDLPYTNLSIVLGNVTHNTEIYDSIALELPDDI